MANRRLEADTSVGVITATFSTLFIDTSLDTHLAMIVSNSDTVSDLKRKIVLEHLQCFPKFGEIRIHALKVKRKGNFYHLSDSMLVCSAFEVGKRNWFVSVDASSSTQHQNDNQTSCRSEASNPLALVCFQQNPSGESSLQKLVITPCTNKKLLDAEYSSHKESKDLNVQAKDNANDDDADMISSDSKEQEKCEAITGGAKDAATNQRDDNSEYVESMRAVKNTRKIKKQDDEVILDRSLEDQFASTNSLVGASREVSNDMEMGSKDVNEEDLHSSPKGKRKRKIGSTESGGNPLEIDSEDRKIKRRRRYDKYIPLVARAEEGRSLNNDNVEINYEDIGKEKHIELVQEVVGRNKVTSPSKGTDMGESDAVNAKGNSDVADVIAGINGSSKRNKNKKRVKKAATSNQNLLGMEQANDSVGEIGLPVVQLGIDHHLDFEIKSKEVSEQKPKDGSSSGAAREDNMIESEAERLPQGDTDVENQEPIFPAKLLEAAEGPVELGKVGGTKKKKEKKVKKSTGGISQTATNSVVNGHSDNVVKKDESFLSHIKGAVEASLQQKPIDGSLAAPDRELDSMSINEMDSLPLTQVNSEKENGVDEKSGNRLTKCQIPTTLKIPSDFPNKEQEHMVESVPLNEVEKNQDASNTVSRFKKKTKKKQKSEAKSRPDLPINEVGVDELTAKTDKHEQMEASNEINFKVYFVPGKDENGSDPVDELKTATRPDKEIKAKKNKKKPVVSSLGTSPELQNKEKPKDKNNNLIPPSKKSLEDSGTAVKTQTSASSNGTSKHNAAAVRKGYAKGTGEVEAVKGSQQEKSLLVTPCAIFSDDSSSDGYADEKKKVNSDTSTHTPSSSSGSSTDSLKNERKEGGRNITKFPKSSGPKNITMDMIFRSSSRFKKAKLTALGDSESQPVDFVPDSQPNV